MTIIDIPDLCNAKPSDGKYKELALKFFDTIEKKYGIKFKMMPWTDFCHKYIRICIQRKKCKNYDTILLILVKHIIISNGGDIYWQSDSYWQLGSFNWRTLFYRIFTYNGENTNFRFACWIRNHYYSTPLYKTLEEFKIAVDMDMVTFELLRK